jgi:2-polyprenyl-3-methyl-5-hydroxy-6-metoxy-1,4-benzoquinol methylase
MARIEILCSSCYSALAKKEKYYCGNCSNEFDYYIFEGTEIVDLRQLNKNVCTCIRDGRTECRISLADLINNAKAKSSSSKDTRPEARIIKHHVGSHNKVLDLGCAEGPFADLISKNNVVIGLDQCPVRLFSNRETALDKGYSLLVIHSNHRLPFTDGEFDVTLSTEVIEHVLDTRNFIKEIRRVLKDKGKLILSTPNIASWKNRLGILLGDGRLIESNIRYPEQRLHIRFFSFFSLKKFLEENGFKITREFGIGLTYSRLDYWLAGSRLFNKILRRLCNTILIVAEKEGGF